MAILKPDFTCPVCGMGVFIKENPESRGQWRARCHWCGLKTDWTASREGAAGDWAELARYWEGRMAPARKKNKDD